MFFVLLLKVRFFLSSVGSDLILSVVILVGIVFLYLFFSSVIPSLTSLVSCFIFAVTISVCGSSLSLKWWICWLLSKIFPVLPIKYSHSISSALKVSSFPEEESLWGSSNAWAIFEFRVTTSPGSQLFSIQILLKFYWTIIKKFFTYLDQICRCHLRKIKINL